jgi:hypothetical protein
MGCERKKRGKSLSESVHDFMFFVMFLNV